MRLEHVPEGQPPITLAAHASATGHTPAAWTTNAHTYQSKRYVPSVHEHLCSRSGRSSTSGTQESFELRLLYEREGVSGEPHQCALRYTSDTNAQTRAQSDEGGNVQASWCQAQGRRSQYNTVPRQQVELLDPSDHSPCGRTEHRAAPPLSHVHRAAQPHRRTVGDQAGAALGRRNDRTHDQFSRNRQDPNI